MEIAQLCKFFKVHTIMSCSNIYIFVIREHVSTMAGEHTLAGPKLKVTP